MGMNGDTYRDARSGTDTHTHIHKLLHINTNTGIRSHAHTHKLIHINTNTGIR